MFDELLDFFVALRRKGFTITIEQCNSVHHVLSVLAKERQYEKQPEKLAGWIAPIICASAEQQREFHTEYEEWLRRRSKKELTEPVDVSPTEPTEPERRWRFTKVHVAVTLASVLIIIGALAFDPRDVDLNAIPPVTIIERPPNETVFVELTSQTKDLSQEERVALLPAWKRFFYKHYQLLRIATAGMPLMAMLAFGMWRFYRRLQLEKQSTLITPDLNRLPLKSASAELFRSPIFRRTSRGLRHQLDTQLYEFDVNATVETTARMAGCLTPIEKPVKATSQYLVLIDRATFVDQQAQLYDELVRKLAKTNVYVDRYFFIGDPRNCYREHVNPHGERSTSPIDLRELRALHPEHQLILFSNGEGLIDNSTHEPHHWADLSSDWNSYFLLTPELKTDWGYREFALSNIGFTVLPSTIDGLETLARLVQTQRLWNQPEEVAIGFFPPILRETEHDWIDENEPSPEVVEELRISLMQFLGMDDYYWLSACAVYPMLDWELTVSLGYNLTGKRNIEERLIQLVRLPWFRFGKMPDWFRNLLLSHLPDDKEQEIRKALDELLTSGSGSGLTIARGDDKPRETLWRRLYERIRRLFSKREPPPVLSPLRDYVFLSFMSGRKPRPLALALPEKLRPLFFSGKSPWLQTSFTKLASHALVVFGLIFLLFPNRPQLPPGTDFVLPNVNVTATPASGFAGNSYNIRVVSANPREFALTSTTLSASLGPISTPPPGVILEEEKAITITNQASSSPESELHAGLKIGPEFPNPVIPLEIQRNGSTVGKFSFRLNNKLNVTPTQVARGQATMIVISSSDCGTYDLRNAVVTSMNPQVTIRDMGNIGNCDLGFRVDVPNTAQAGILQLTVKKENGSIPFTLNVVSPECPTVTVTNSRGPWGYRFNATVTGGQPVGPTGFTWRVVQKDQQGQSIIFNDVEFAGQGSSSITVSRIDLTGGDTLEADVRVTGYDATCRLTAGDGFVVDDDKDSVCPRVTIQQEDLPTSYTFKAFLDGGRAITRLTFKWTITDTDGALLFENQGSSSVQVDKNLVNASGKPGVAVIVGGYDRACDALARQLVRITPLITCPKVEIASDKLGEGTYRFYAIASGKDIPLSNLRYQWSAQVKDTNSTKRQRLRIGAQGEPTTLIKQLLKSSEILEVRVSVKGIGFGCDTSAVTTVGP